MSECIHCATAKPVSSVFSLIGLHYKGIQTEHCAQVRCFWFVCHMLQQLMVCVYSEDACAIISKGLLMRGLFSVCATVNSDTHTNEPKTESEVIGDFTQKGDYLTVRQK